MELSKSIKNIIFFYIIIFVIYSLVEFKVYTIKLKISIIKIFALRKEYKIAKRVKLKLDIIENILIWLLPKNQIVIKTFLDTIQYIYY